MQFADDTKIGRPVKNLDDARMLQVRGQGSGGK